MEEMFKEHLQKSIVPTTIRKDGVEHHYFLSYIEDLDPLSNDDDESKCMYRCLDNITSQELMICVKDVISFEESGDYMRDPDKDKENILAFIADQKAKHDEIVTSLNSATREQ